MREREREYLLACIKNVLSPFLSEQSHTSTTLDWTVHTYKDLQKKSLGIQIGTFLSAG